jgi:UDP-glucose 4-epimerase
MRILLTGGAGYIGSHLAVYLLELGYQVILFDNLKKSSKAHLTAITSASSGKLIFIEGDLLDTALLQRVLKSYHIQAVIHLASFKSIPESISNPLVYYENNVSGTISLLNAMQEANVLSLIFSSSCAVYGHSNLLPLKESNQRCPENPYGKTKYFIEEILNDISHTNKAWNIVCLRYSNVSGFFMPSIFSNISFSNSQDIFSVIAQVMMGKLKKVPIYGQNYPTEDGTTKRDYIHVLDIAKAHFQVLNWIKHQEIKFEIFNLGTGRAYSILEVISSFEKCSGIKIPYEFYPARQGDVIESYCCNVKAKTMLNWQAIHNLKDICLSIFQMIIKNG